MVEMALWGISWHFWMIAALTLACLGQCIGIQKIMMCIAVPVGMLGGWTLGWMLGATRFEFLKSLDYGRWVEAGLLYKGGFGFLGAIVLGTAILLLALPWRAQQKPVRQQPAVHHATAPQAPPPPPQ